MKHQIFLNLVIADFNDITHDEISEKLGIIPAKVYIKGQKKNPNSPSLNPALVTTNRWIMGSSKDEYSSFEDQLNSMLDIIEPKIHLFKPFCERYNCDFVCALYLRFNNNESIPTVYLYSRYNAVIKELNIGFDIDIYCLPNSTSQSIDTPHDSSGGINANDL